MTKRFRACILLAKFFEEANMFDMFEMWRKNMLFSLGAVVYTVEKTGEIIDDFIKKGAETLEKREELFRDIRDKVKKEGGKFEKKVEEQVAKAIEKLDIPTKKDIDDLKKKLDIIAKKMKVD